MTGADEGREGLGPGASSPRDAIANGYVALYRFDGEKVVVAHVFHQAQDYARLV